MDNLHTDRVNATPPITREHVSRAQRGGINGESGSLLPQFPVALKPADVDALQASVAAEAIVNGATYYADAWLKAGDDGPVSLELYVAENIPVRYEYDVVRGTTVTLTLLPEMVPVLAAALADTVRRAQNTARVSTLLALADVPPRRLRLL